jgi:hypothetical protein
VGILPGGDYSARPAVLSESVGGKYPLGSEIFSKDLNPLKIGYFETETDLCRADELSFPPLREKGKHPFIESAPSADPSCEPRLCAPGDEKGYLQSEGGKPFFILPTFTFRQVGVKLIEF